MSDRLQMTLYFSVPFALPYVVSTLRGENPRKIRAAGNRVIVEPGCRTGPASDENQPELAVCRLAGNLSFLRVPRPWSVSSRVDRDKGHFWDPTQSGFHVP